MSPSFATLGLSPDLIQAVSNACYQHPTAIQVQAIPLILAGKDLIAEAKTGTGKTAGFVLPILQELQKDAPLERQVIKALILTPTRELAVQVNGQIKIYGRNLTKPLRRVLLVGGLNIDVQLRTLMHGVDIAVATPGRLLDVVLKQKVDFTHLRFLVIDEADKMFHLGFEKELEAVLNLLPQQRQNLLFSATIDERVKKLAHKFMPEAKHVKIAETSPTADNIVQRIIEVNRNNRGPLLRHLILSQQWKHALIFVASVRDADVLTAKLHKANIKVNAFHGGLTQAQRTMVLNDFKAKRFQVMVATDLAARGIDIQGLPIVVNYDLPRSPEDYIHRVGRTARAGADGCAITFIGHEDQEHFTLIEKRIRLRITREQVKGFELTGAPLPKVIGQEPIKGKRMSKKDKARLLQKKAG